MPKPSSQSSQAVNPLKRNRIELRSPLLRPSARKWSKWSRIKLKRALISLTPSRKRRNIKRRQSRLQARRMTASPPKSKSLNSKFTSIRFINFSSIATTSNKTEI